VIEDARVTHGAAGGYTTGRGARGTLSWVRGRIAEETKVRGRVHNRKGCKTKRHPVTGSEGGLQGRPRCMAGDCIYTKLTVEGLDLVGAVGPFWHHADKAGVTRLSLIIHSMLIPTMSIAYMVTRSRFYSTD
jgi:hypothetical protein